MRRTPNSVFVLFLCQRLPELAMVSCHFRKNNTVEELNVIRNRMPGNTDWHIKSMNLHYKLEGSKRH